MLFSDINLTDLIKLIELLRDWPECVQVWEVALAELNGRCSLPIELERTGEAPAVSG